MKRIFALDLARGFTVLFIPVVHAVLIFGNEHCHASVVGDVLSFIAEWQGAQVFMVLMGVGIGIKNSELGIWKVFHRILKLTILAFILNVLKFVVLFLFDGLPKSFLNEMQVDNVVDLLLIGDIFHFAAAALLILYMIQKMPDPVLVALLIATGVAFLSPVTWTGMPPQVFFPLIPWLVYPLVGFVIGRSIKEHGERVFPVLILVGVGLMVCSFCVTIYFDTEPDVSFYVAGSWSTLRHLGFVCCWLAMWFYISKLKSNLMFDGLVWLSKNITVIYVISWPVIFWLVPVLGYRKLNVIESVVIGVDVSLFSFLVAYLLRKIKRPKTFQGPLIRSFF